MPNRSLRALTAVASALALLAGACSGGGGGGRRVIVCEVEGFVANPVRFVRAFAGLAFSSPLALVPHPDDPDRFYVVERGGRIFTFLASSPAATRREAVDVRDFVTLFSGGEGGLLGLAFAPDFDTSGELYLSYTEGVAASFDSVLARYESSDGGLSFRPAAPDPVVLAVDQPDTNHNGGDLHFGPDGFLYWALGDGGGAFDPGENGQDVTTLLGSILRLDVSVSPYRIPPGNPFVGSAGADEIFAFGQRNPWRMRFDRDTGELWAADVGQEQQEEANVVVSGGNYGWDCEEGFADLEKDDDCRPDPIAPEFAHAHDHFESITGGVVYRGAAIPSLVGSYVYGDFVTGRVCAFDAAGNGRSRSLDPPDGLRVVAFAEDADGELYVVDFGGAIYAIVPAP